MSAEARIAPWLLVRHAEEAAAFYKAAFHAVELHRLEGDGGKLELAQLAVQGAEFWIQEDAEFDPNAAGSGRGLARMILTVEDPDSLFDQAVTAGAAVIVAMEEAHGWRVGRIADPLGHHWEIGKQL